MTVLKVLDPEDPTKMVSVDEKRAQVYYCRC